MEGVGQYLKAERERQQRSLQELADITRISKTTLQAIEDERSALLPHLSYVRGFLRIYAKELRLDPEEIIERYERGLRERCWEPQKALKETGPRSRGKYLAAAFVVALLLTALFLWRAANRLQHGEQPAPAADPAAGYAQAPAAPEVPEASGPPDDGAGLAEPQLFMEAPAELPAAEPPLAAEPAAPAQGFMVAFVATELTWVKIAVDGQEPFEVMLRPGESYRKNAQQSMKVRIGNAGGLAVFFNDTPLGVLGEHGKLLDLEFPEDARNP